MPKRSERRRGMAPFRHGSGRLAAEVRVWRYHPGYYAAYVLDPDGNNIEVVNHH